MRYEFPKRMMEHATRGWAEKGEVWLKELPDILDRCCDKWELTLGATSEEIKANYIGYATRANGEDVVLKVGVPHRDFNTEMEALAIYDECGINRLIDRGLELNAMLIERVRPGRTLSSIADKKAQATAAAHIMVDLQISSPPSGHTLPHFLEWVEGSHEDAKGCLLPQGEVGVIQEGHTTTEMGSVEPILMRKAGSIMKSETSMAVIRNRSVTIVDCSSMSAALVDELCR